MYENVFIRLRGVKKRGDNSWMACCPAHDDSTPSLSVLEIEDKLLVKCWAGCTFAMILEAMGLKSGDFFMPNEERKVVRTHQYLDYDRKLLFEVIRYEPKSFSQRRPNPDFNRELPESSTNQRWIYNLNGVQRVLYKYPELLDMAASKQDRYIFVCEGEGKVDYLAKLNLLATTNPHGAGKWESQYTANLKGCKVIVIPDEDAPGLKHARAVCLALNGVAKSVSACRVPSGFHQVDEWLDSLPEAQRRQALITLAMASADKDPLDVIGPIEINPASVMLTVSRIALKLNVSDGDIADAMGFLEAARENRRPKEQSQSKDQGMAAQPTA